MTDQSTVPAVRRTVTVAAPIERAFEVFTAGFTTWWPADHHIGAAEPAEFRLEQHAGGRWYELGKDRSECEWGRVLAWEPPHRVLLSWQINGEWQVDPDPARGTEVEVRFTAEGPDATRVDLEHRLFERLGPTGTALREQVDSAGGWGDILRIYAAATGA